MVRRGWAGLWAAVWGLGGVPVWSCEGSLNPSRTIGKKERGVLEIERSARKVGAAHRWCCGDGGEVAGAKG